MRQLAIALTAAAFLSAASTAAAAPPDWRAISNASDGNFSVVFYIDAASVERQGNVAQFIERAEFTNHVRGWQQVISQTLIDCEANRTRVVRMKVTMADGTAKVFDRSKVREWTVIRPQSNGAFEREFVCRH